MLLTFRRNFASWFGVVYRASSPSRQDIALRAACGSLSDKSTIPSAQLPRHEVSTAEILVLDAWYGRIGKLGELQEAITGP